DNFRKQFEDAVGDNLNMPEALAVVWASLKSNIPGRDKYDLVMSFDEILGLQLDQPASADQLPITPEIKKLLDEREALRKAGNFEEADKIRDELIKKGYTVSDAAAKR